MPKSSNFREDRIAKAFAAGMSQKKPNISKIASEFVMIFLDMKLFVDLMREPYSSGLHIGF
jgi:hypothetical protein